METYNFRFLSVTRDNEGFLFHQTAKQRINDLLYLSYDWHFYDMLMLFLILAVLFSVENNVRNCFISLLVILFFTIGWILLNREKNQFIKKEDIKEIVIDYKHKVVEVVLSEDNPLPKRDVNFGGLSFDPEELSTFFDRPVRTFGYPSKTYPLLNIVIRLCLLYAMVRMEILYVRECGWFFFRDMYALIGILLPIIASCTDVIIFIRNKRKKSV